MGAADMNCTELVLLMRYKSLSKQDQQRVGMLISLLSGDIQMVGPEHEFPAELAE